MDGFLKSPFRGPTAKEALQLYAAQRHISYGDLLEAIYQAGGTVLERTYRGKSQKECFRRAVAGYLADRWFEKSDELQYLLDMAHRFHLDRNLCDDPKVLKSSLIHTLAERPNQLRAIFENVRKNEKGRQKLNTPDGRAQKQKPTGSQMQFKF
jgi:hypothetical protein